MATVPNPTLICQISQVPKKLHIISCSDYLLLVVSNVKLYWWSLLSLTYLTQSSLLQYGKTQSVIGVSVQYEHLTILHKPFFLNPSRSFLV